MAISGISIRGIALFLPIVLKMSSYDYDGLAWPSWCCIASFSSRFSSIFSGAASCCCCYCYCYCINLRLAANLPSIWLGYFYRLASLSPALSLPFSAPLSLLSWPYPFSSSWILVSLSILIAIFLRAFLDERLRDFFIVLTSVSLRRSSLYYSCSIFSLLLRASASILTIR